MTGMHYGAGIIGFILGALLGPWLMALVGIKR